MKPKQSSKAMHGTSLGTKATRTIFANAAWNAMTGSEIFYGYVGARICGYMTTIEGAF